MIITIDGPVAAGKTTAARLLSGHFRFTLLDTGAIYRCVALSAQMKRSDWHNEPKMTSLASELDIDFILDQGVHRVFLEGEDVTRAIRQPEISQGSSIVSALPGVRDALLDLQRQRAEREHVIAEGRDTGTVVFPKAQIKFFLTAEPRIRAHRRHLELLAKGMDTDLEQVSRELHQRDERDTSRAIAPLIPAVDAVIVDSTNLDATEVNDRMKVKVSQVLGSR